MMRSDKPTPRHPLNAADDALRAIDQAISTSRTAQAVERVLQSAAPSLNAYKPDLEYVIAHDLGMQAPRFYDCDEFCDCCDPYGEQGEMPRDTLNEYFVVMLAYVEATFNNLSALQADEEEFGIIYPQDITRRITR